MQIILQEDVDKLGNRGEVVTVAEGYARNFLLPKKLALPASEGNLKRLAKIRATLEKKTASERDVAQKQADAVNAITVTLIRKAGEHDNLFGSVNAADIAEAIAKQGQEVDRRRIQLNEPIKTLGEFQVPVKLHRDVVAQVKVIVQRDEQPKA